MIYCFVIVEATSARCQIQERRMSSLVSCTPKAPSKTFGRRSQQWAKSGTCVRSPSSQPYSWPRLLGKIKQKSLLAIKKHASLSSMTCGNVLGVSDEVFGSKVPTEIITDWTYIKWCLFSCILFCFAQLCTGKILAVQKSDYKGGVELDVRAGPKDTELEPAKRNFEVRSQVSPSSS